MIFFVGIGGSGMFPLARYALSKGFCVCGSDCRQSENCDKLISLGAKIVFCHDKANVANAERVVYSLAAENTPEVVFAKTAGLNCVSREKFLGEIFSSFEDKTAVCGTHGKTTVATMTSSLLNACKKPCALFAGAEGESDFSAKSVVAEACEYRKSFLTLFTDLTVCTSVDFDHPDCYADLNATQQSFREFFSQSKKLVCSEQALSVADGFVEKAVFGVGEKCDFKAENIKLTDSFSEFDFKSPVGGVRLKLNASGAHNVMNCLAACSVAVAKGVDLACLASAVENLRSPQRRWQIVAEKPCQVVVDYAHHPTQIKAAIDCATLTKKRVVVFFQPHTFSRTDALFDEFASAFDKAVFVGILPTFAAREEQTPQNKTARDLVCAARERGANAHFFDDVCSVANYVKQNCCLGDVVLLLGAGDVDKAGELLK